mgnify:CR=1 FL=1
MLKEFLGLLADVNPAEIASHIAQGNLHEWCDNWRSAAEEAAVQMDNRVPVTSWSNEDLVRRSDLDCRGLTFLRHADGSDYTQYERGYNDAVISIYGMVSSAPCATETVEIDSRLDERDAKIILGLADSQMNVSEVGRQLFMHRNTIVYHIDKIRKVTGLNPLNFYDLFKLTYVARQMLGGK